MIALIITLSVVVFIILLLSIMGYIIHKKFFGYHTYNDPDITYYTSEEYDIKSTPVETKVSKDTIRGFLYEKEVTHKDKIVIYSHGMWSTIDAYMQDIAYLVLNGYQVIAFNHVGVGTSDGKTLKGFGDSLASLDAAIKYIKSNDELKNKDIYVIGHSWGGFSTINIVKFYPDIKKICAISPFISPYQIINSTLKGITKIFAPFICFFDRFSYPKFARVNGIKSLRNYKGKALIISSDDDNVVDYPHATKRIKDEVKNDNIKYIIVQNKKHHPHYSALAHQTLIEFNNGMRGLSSEEKVEFKRNFNFHQMGELDKDIMDKIVEFFND